MTSPSLSKKHGIKRESSEPAGTNEEASSKYAPEAHVKEHNSVASCVWGGGSEGG
jgi:hypothetical protein